MSDPINISIVIPVYNSAKIFPFLCEQLVTTLESAVDSFEIIAVVDGCSDNSAEVVAQHSEKDSRVKLIEFSRNFGNQMAITAGLQASRGDMVVVMDDDLEDPPDIIPRLIQKAEEGYEVVYAVRKERKISTIRHAVYKAYYRALNKFSSFEIPEDVGDFCLMRRPIVDVLNSMPENNRYIRGLRAWAGFSQAGVEFDRQARHSGISGFDIFRYFKFAFDGIFSFSYKPLFYVTLIGVVISISSLALALILIFLKLTARLPDVPGWASIAVSVLFIGGIQLLSIGILGQYVGRIYDEVKQRPPFIIKRSIGLDDGTDPD
jgi:polyisoprenyl-phosphate glycosyltransferase